MYGRVCDLPEQIEEGWRIGREIRLPEEYRDVRSVVLVGMGGSAIGGSLLGAYAAREIPVPFSVHRGYGLPAFVNRDTLVIAASYSGGTEETLSGFREARERGARLLALTTGGEIGSLASAWQVPTVRFAYKAQPRATLGYLFTPLLAVFAGLGFLPAQDDAVAESIRVTRALRDAWKREVPASANLAKRLARQLQDRLALVYGAEYLGEVAHRWKTQLNENAKCWAFWEEFPELNHNAVVGYDHPISIGRETVVLILNGTHLSARTARRIGVTSSLLAQHNVAHEEVRGEGESSLAQTLSLVQLGDFVSYYLALLNGVDPTTIEPIDYLKSELARA